MNNSGSDEMTLYQKIKKNNQPPLILPKKESVLIEGKEILKNPDPFYISCLINRFIYLNILNKKLNSSEYPYIIVNNDDVNNDNVNNDNDDYDSGDDLVNFHKFSNNISFDIQKIREYLDDYKDNIENYPYNCLEFFIIKKENQNKENQDKNNEIINHLIKYDVNFEYFSHFIKKSVVYFAEYTTLYAYFSIKQTDVHDKDRLNDIKKNIYTNFLIDTNLFIVLLYEYIKSKIQDKSLYDKLDSVNFFYILDDFETVLELHLGKFKNENLDDAYKSEYKIKIKKLNDSITNFKKNIRNIETFNYNNKEEVNVNEDVNVNSKKNNEDEETVKVKENEPNNEDVKTETKYDIDILDYYFFDFYNVKYNFNFTDKSKLLKYITYTDNCDLTPKDLLLNIIYLEPSVYNKFIGYYKLQSSKPDERELIDNDLFFINKKEYRDYLVKIGYPILGYFTNFCIINANFNTNSKLHYYLNEYYHYLNNDGDENDDDDDDDDEDENDENNDVYSIQKNCKLNNGEFFYKLIKSRINKTSYLPNLDKLIKDNDNDEYMSYFTKNNIFKQIYNGVVYIYNTSSNKFIDIWKFIKSNKFLTINIIAVSLLVKYIVYDLAVYGFNYEMFENYIQDLLTKYSFFDVKNISNNPEIQLALKNCEKFNFIPERVFSNSIEDGLKFSTAYLFNRISRLIDLYKEGKIENGDDFSLVSGITMNYINFENLEPYLYNFIPITYNSILPINEIIMVQKHVKVEKIINWLMHYYQGDIDLDEYEEVFVNEIQNSFYLMENHELYYIYIILGKELIPCKISRFDNHY